MTPRWFPNRKLTLIASVTCQCLILTEKIICIEVITKKMFGLLGPEKTVRKNKKQIWSVSLMLLQNIFEKKEKKKVIFFKNKLKKRGEKTNPSFCKKPHSMWKIEKGLGKKIRKNWNLKKGKIKKNEKKEKIILISDCFLRVFLPLIYLLRPYST